MQKLVKDGSVAVLVSPGFGAGWSTWSNDPTLCFDKDIIEKILSEEFDEAIEIAESKYPGVYVGGVNQCVVEWIPEGAVFKIDEYDGHETISIVGDNNYLTA